MCITINYIHYYDTLGHRKYTSKNKYYSKNMLNLREIIQKIWNYDKKKDMHSFSTLFTSSPEDYGV